MQRFVTDENKKWWTLAAVSVGLFMIMLDNTVVNVALPSIRTSLHMAIEASSGWSPATRSRSPRSCSSAASSPTSSAGA